jgi:hypothetical protein
MNFWQYINYITFSYNTSRKLDGVMENFANLEYK